MPTNRRDALKLHYQPCKSGNTKWSCAVIVNFSVCQKCMDCWKRNFWKQEGNHPVTKPLSFRSGAYKETSDTNSVPQMGQRQSTDCLGASGSRITTDKTLKTYSTDEVSLCVFGASNSPQHSNRNGYLNVTVM